MALPRLLDRQMRISRSKDDPVGKKLHPVFGDQRPCSEFTPPVQNLGPHVAALGMRFYTGSRFPGV